VAPAKRVRRTAEEKRRIVEALIGDSQAWPSFKGERANLQQSSMQWMAPTAGSASLALPPCGKPTHGSSLAAAEGHACLSPVRAQGKHRRNHFFPLNGRELTSEDESSVVKAIHPWKDSATDFDDCLINVRNRRSGCRTTATFDRKALQLTPAKSINRRCPIQAFFWLEWGCSADAASLPALRSRLAAVHSDSMSTRPLAPVA
jgi:hypothetical protein